MKLEEYPLFLLEKKIEYLAFAKISKIPLFYL